MFILTIFQTIDFSLTDLVDKDIAFEPLEEKDETENEEEEENNRAQDEDTDDDEEDIDEDEDEPDKVNSVKYKFTLIG